MNPPDFDDMGPRIDVSAAEEEQRPGAAPRLPRNVVPPTAARRGGGSGVLGVLALLLAILALAVAAWGAFLRQPEAIPAPPVNPDVVPGATAERVAKLEKDVSSLILRVVTLEKELQNLAGKAGSVNKVTQLSAAVAALQDRLDSLSLDSKLSNLAQRGQPQAAEEEPARPEAAEQEAAPAQEAKPKPQAQAEEPAGRKKHLYTVRRGDTLYTVSVRYKVKMRDIMRWNDMNKGDVIKVGQKLVIYK